MYAYRLDSARAFTVPSATMALSPLRSPSARPEVLTDEHPGAVVNTLGYQTGVTGKPLGRDRVIQTLPLAGGPQLLDPAKLLHDGDFGYVADRLGHVIGERAATWVGRMLSATVTGDTRRL